MKRFLEVAAFIALLLSISFPQQIDITGKLLDFNNNPIPNAVATLMKTGLTDTTGANGIYHLYGQAGVIPKKISGINIPSPTMVGGTVRLQLKQNGHLVTIDRIGLRGQRLERILDSRLQQGTYAFTISSLSMKRLAEGIMLLDVRVDGKSTVFRTFNTHRNYTAARFISLTSGAGIAKLAGPDGLDTLTIIMENQIISKVVINAWVDTIPVIQIKPTKVVGQLLPSSTPIGTIEGKVTSSNVLDPDIRFIKLVYDSVPRTYSGRIYFVVNAASPTYNLCVRVFDDKAIMTGHSGWVFFTKGADSVVVPAFDPCANAPSTDSQPVWQNVGPTAFTDADANFLSLVSDRDGVLYAAFSDASAGDKASVMQYNGAAWEPLGTRGFSKRRAFFPSIVASTLNKLYCAYLDYPLGSQIDRGVMAVMSFNGSAWVPVGTTDSIAIASNDENAICLDKQDVPFIAYADMACSGKITVKRFLCEKNWETVGTPGLSTGLAAFINLACDAEGRIIVAYADRGNHGTATVMRYSCETGWSMLGNTGFSGDTTSYFLRLTVHDTIPYIVFNGNNQNWQVTVMRYFNGKWEAVGGKASDGFATDISIGCDLKGVVHVAYEDQVNGKFATVRRYNSGIWETVGTKNVSAGEARYTNLLFDAQNMLYLGYRDMVNTGITVLTYR